jgi:uncharacterized protein YjiS (DUF1127 family)
MSAIEIFDSIPREVPDRIHAVSALRNAVRAWLLTIEEHRALKRISRMSPHLICDLGFEPAAIYEATDGTWDGVRFRGLSN